MSDAEAAFSVGTGESGGVTTNASVISTPMVQSTNTSQITGSGRFYSDEDLAKARAQEKEKLYPQIDKLKEELAALKAAEDARKAEAERLAKEAEEAARKRAEEEMDVRALLAKKDQEWQAQLAERDARLEAERQEREKALAMVEAERRYNELQNYRTKRVEEERDAIMPELLDLISGNTPDEIEASIAGLRERSSRIFESAASAFQQNRQQMAGSRVTSPAAGPLDTDSGQRTFTPDDIAGMSMDDYAKNRNRLLGQLSSSRNRGMFG